MVERLLIFGVFVSVIGVPAGITWAKGQRESFFLGWLLLGMIWVVAACRLARPDSPWARRFYGPKRLNRAEERFGRSEVSEPI